MKLFLDCSDPELIARAFETGLIDGVTTNPSLMLKAGEDPRDVIKEISAIFPWNASVSAEVVGETAEEMLDMAQDYLEIGPNITIKVPCTVEGLKACRELAYFSPCVILACFSHMWFWHVPANIIWHVSAMCEKNKTRESQKEKCYTPTCIQVHDWDQPYRANKY